MLGLAEQVYRDHEGVGVLVGNHQDLSRAGEQVDADLAEQLALGLGDVGVTRAGEQVDLADGLGPYRHRGHRLGAAEQEDLVCASELKRGYRGGGNLTLDRRRAGGNPRDAGDLSGHHGHVGRRDERIAAAGHVGARRRHRDVLLAEEYAGLSLDLKVAQRVQLVLGERPYPLLGRPGCRSITCSGTVAMIFSMSSSESRKLAGDQPSNFSEYSRTAASPRSRTAAITSMTVSLTL